MESSIVNLNTVSIKAKSKGEMYRMLVCEGNMYLMPQKEWGMAFISDIWVGHKKVFTSFVGFVLFYFHIGVVHRWGDNLTGSPFEKSTH